MSARLALALVATTAASVTAIATHHHRRPTHAPARVTSAPAGTVLNLREPVAPRRRLSPERRASRRHTRPALRLVQGDGLDWPALARCESTDNPRAIDPTGTYFGLYQFDILTWRSVGGRGNPAYATRAEQTFRARILYGQRGRTPWPVCGANL